MLVLRLSRVGRENLAFFKLVAQEKTWPAKSSKAVEILGSYNPREKNNALKFKRERVELFLKNGATPSPTVASLLKKSGVAGVDKFLERYTKKKPRKAPPEAAAKPAA